MTAVRTARQEDLAALLAIYNDEVVNGTATLDLHPQSMETRQSWFDAHNVDNHPLIVAELDGRIAGYASLSSYRPKEAYSTTVELSVYVARTCRNRGVASALMQAILDLARQDPRTHTVVSVITSGNEASTHLHRKFGFTFAGTVPEVAFKMGKCLGIDSYFLIV